MTSSRGPHVLLVLAAFLAGLVVFLGVFLYATGQMNSGTGVAAVSSVGGPFRLTDQDGNAITDQNLKGKPSLVFFGYTHCPDVCPTTLFEVSEILQTLGPDAGKANALFITVDPERDTPKVMKDYLSSFDPRLRAASGNREQIDAVEKAYRVYAKKVPTGNGDYSMDHTALVYLMDKDGRFVAPFKLKQKPEEAAAELRRYM